MILRDVLSEEFQKEIEDSFALATGFGVVFTDTTGKHLGPGGNFCKFCNKMNTTEEGSKHCTQTNHNAIALALSTHKPSIYICHAGLVNIEIPIIYENEFLGALTAGQVICSVPDYYPKDALGKDDDWLSDPELASYYDEIEVLTPEKIEATATAMNKLSNYIIQKVAMSKMEKQLDQKTKQLLLAKHQLKVAELDALQKQVTPHFIFNVLNSVSRLMSLKDYDVAQDMLTSFTSMMRYSLSNVKDTVFLSQELEYIKNYLFIQHIRFGDRICYHIQCDEDMKKIMIPFFSIQPLVENSIEHGLLNMESGGKLDISCVSHGQDYQIQIRDNGIGIPSAQLAEICSNLGTKITDNSHIGLSNCYNRFLLLFENSFSFDIESAPEKGTKITIRLNLNQPF